MFGILLQGQITEWTKDVIKEYRLNFPDSEILVSTWENENTTTIPCNVIKAEPPSPTNPYFSNVNHQKIGTLAGLEKMSSEIILKCRTDQYIHNKHIFDIYEESCPDNKIMIPNYATIRAIDYFASDFCQIATREILLKYWNSIQPYDGSFFIGHPEIYLTSCYIKYGKKDSRSWPVCLKEYYYVKDFHKDFQIEWEKLAKFKDPYQKWHDEWWPLCVEADR
jgi:hypothetical protein